MSVLHGRLLFGTSSQTRLYFYNREGLYLSNTSISNNDKLYDAIWTRQGNIVYTTITGHKVVVMSMIGIVSTEHSNLTDARHLSTSGDAIYLADWGQGVYRSVDDGVSWHSLFKGAIGQCVQLIKVTVTDHSDDYWSITYIKRYRIRVYSLNRSRSGSNFTSKDTDILTNSTGFQIRLQNNRISYDGNNSIFLTDGISRSIHVLSVTGHYHCQLITPHYIKSSPTSLAVDQKQHLLFVRQASGVVSVFKWIY